MNLIFITNAMVCKRLGEPSIKYSKTQKGNEVATFKVSEKVFDPDSENQTAYYNWYCKCFNDLAKTVEKMKLEAGSRVNLEGTVKKSSYTDEHGSVHEITNIFVNRIEYAASYQKKEGEKTEPEDTKEVETEEAPTERANDLKTVNLDELDESKDPFLDSLFSF